MADKQFMLTYEGLEKLEQELEHLKTVTRKEVTEKIKQALAFGDLSENSEYDAAKNEQAQVEARISQIEYTLKNANVVDEEAINTDTVNIGNKVKILDIEFNEEMEFTIVGTAEASPSKHKLSYESPVGGALIGKKINEVVDVTTPSGTVQFKILDISK